MDALRASVLKTPPSSSAISRRATLSRVVSLFWNVILPTKYCLSYCMSIVTSTVRLSGCGSVRVCGVQLK